MPPPAKKMKTKAARRTTMPELTLVIAAVLAVLLVVLVLAQVLGASGIIRWISLLARLGLGVLAVRWLFYPAAEIIASGQVAFGGVESTVFSVPDDKIVEVAPVVWLVALARIALGGGFFTILFMPYYERWAAMEAGSIWRFWSAALIAVSLALYVLAAAVYWIFYK
jgi:hypothetical protein